MNASASAREKLAVRPRVKVWLELQGEHVFCSQMCVILQAIEQTNSIKAAAAQVGLSYRHVWGLLKQVEQSFGTPLVASQVGGSDARRSSLTPTGRALVESYSRLQTRLHAASDECAAELRAVLRRKAN